MRRSSQRVFDKAPERAANSVRGSINGEFAMAGIERKARQPSPSGSLFAALFAYAKHRIGCADPKARALC
ncbi:MAG: hypothetical protein ACYYK0_01155 [Candidatus Eutrophobiaceae bacterium]